MFNRREILKYLGIGTSAAAAGQLQSAEATTRPSVFDGCPVKAADLGRFTRNIEETSEAVDELLRFYREATEVCPGLFPDVVRMGLGCSPPRCYVNVPIEVRQKVKAPALKGPPVYPDFYNVRGLWERVKPSYIYELPVDQPVTDAAADFFERKRAGTLKEAPNVLVPGRVNSPVFVIDRDEADAYTVAFMSCACILVAKGLHSDARECLSRVRDSWRDADPRGLEGDCWMTSIRCHMNIDDNIFSFYAEVVTAGRIYHIDDSKTDVAARRRDPWHWHKLPEELIKEVS
jgi:hypothetical protein